MADVVVVILTEKQLEDMADAAIRVSTYPLPKGKQQTIFLVCCYHGTVEVVNSTLINQWIPPLMRVVRQLYFCLENSSRPDFEYLPW